MSCELDERAADSAYKTMAIATVIAGCMELLTATERGRAADRRHRLNGRRHRARRCRWRGTLIRHARGSDELEAGRGRRAGDHGGRAARDHCPGGELGRLAGTGVEPRNGTRAHSRSGRDRKVGTRRTSHRIARRALAEGSRPPRSRIRERGSLTPTNRRPRLGLTSALAGTSRPEGSGCASPRALDLLLSLAGTPGSLDHKPRVGHTPRRTVRNTRFCVTAYTKVADGG